MTLSLDNRVYINNDQRCYSIQNATKSFHNFRKKNLYNNNGLNKIFNKQKNNREISINKPQYYKLNLNNNSILKNQKSYETSYNIINNNNSKNMFKRTNPNNNYKFKKQNLYIEDSKNKNLKEKEDQKEKIKDQNQNNDEDNKIKNDNKYGTCYSCERAYKKELLFCSECKIHYFCKSCLNLHYARLFENEIPNLECPVYTCHYNIDIDQFKNVINENNFKALFRNKTNKKNKRYNLTKILKKNTSNNIKNSIIEINSKDQLIRSIKDKKNYCPKCNFLIYETNSHFYKCLYCNYKKCKYCLKEYTRTHLISNEKDYCKVYCRTKKDDNTNYVKQYFRQLIFVLAIFFLCILGSFILPFNFFKHLFKVENKKIKNNYLFIKIFFSYIFSIIIMITIIPIIILLFPYFPSFVAFLDFN